jgi:hypothetical protein
LFTQAALAHLVKVMQVVLVKVLTGFQKRQAVAAAHLLWGQIMPHQVFLALVVRVLHHQSAVLRLPTQAVVAVAVLPLVLVVLVAAALEAHLLDNQALLEQLTLAVVVVVQTI